MSRPKQGKERPGGCAIERAHRNKIEESDSNIGRSADSQCGVQRAEVAVPPVDQTDERGCGEQQLADYTAPRDLCGFHFCLGMIETTESVNWVDLNREHAIAETSGNKLMPEFVHDENEEVGADAGKCMKDSIGARKKEESCEEENGPVHENRHAVHRSQTYQRRYAQSDEDTSCWVLRNPFGDETIAMKIEATNRVPATSDEHVEERRAGAKASWKAPRLQLVVRTG